MGKCYQDGFPWRSAAAACFAVAAGVLCLRGGGGDGGVWLASSPEDLREALREAQLGLLPLEGAALHDAGEALFLPGGDEDDAFLLSLLLDSEGGGESLDVTVSEDALTRETLFHGPGGGLVWALPPEGGYDPWWVAGLFFPEEDFSGFDDPGAFDPSLAGLRVTLVPLVFPDIPDGRQGGGGEAPGAGEQTPPPLRWPQRDVPYQSPPEGNGPIAEPPPAAETNEVAGVTLLEAAPPTGRVVYVDAARGSDAWTGRSSFSRGGGEGPKRTVGGGMAAAGGGGSLVIAGGAYAERLDVRGTGVRVTFSGDVTLGGRPAD